MDLLVAIGHIVGALVLYALLMMAILAISSWEAVRNRKILLNDLAFRLGVPVTDLENEEKAEELAPKVFEILMEKFSDEHFRNRFSDFLGVVRSIWNWFGGALQVVFIIAVCWYSFTEALDNAIYAWFINAAIVFFYVFGVVYSLICKLLTGRFPGQAKEARQLLTKHHNEFVA